MNLDILFYPFMQRALIAGVLLSILLGLMGIFVTARKMAFFGDGIAHSALFGIAIASLLGFAPLPVALIVSILAALIISKLETTTKLPSDALIGIIFTAAMAAGIVTLSLKSGYQPELISYLFGSILTISQTDLYVMIGLSTAIIIWILFSLKPLTFASLTEESAAVSGIPVKRYTTLLYCTLAIAIILSAKMLGVILVSALLIIPAATSRLLTTSFKSHLSSTITIAVITTTLGLIISALVGTPSGATIVLVGTAIFFLAILISKSSD
jgi:zinc transport system permease protein